MSTLRCGWSLGLAALALMAVAAHGAEITNLIGVVKDAQGRPLGNPVDRGDEEPEPGDVKVEVCGLEYRLADGGWGRNHRPHCLLPRTMVDKTGRFTVWLRQEPELRVNLWASKTGYAPRFVSTIPDGKELTVTLLPGTRVSGHVNRRVNGRLEPVQGTNVTLQCAWGDIAQQKEVFENPYWTSVPVKEGDDRPYQERQLTGALGEYTFQVSPPPRGKKWFLICQDQIVPLEVKEGQPIKGPDFEIKTPPGTGQR